MALTSCKCHARVEYKLSVLIYRWNISVTNFDVNYGGWGVCIPKIYGGGWLYITIPQYGWLTGQLSGPQHNKIAPAYSEPIGLVTVDSTSSSFTSISKICISLGGLSTMPPIGSSPLDPTG